MTGNVKPLRVDAERNRRAIINTAGTVFAEEGTDVTLEQIAVRAGVGVGTIYRRFSSIRDLLDVVLEEKMHRYADRTEDAAAKAEYQPWEAFRDWVLFVLEQQATDLAFSDIILSAASVSERFHTDVRRALRASISLVNRTRSAGAIRRDFDHSDLLMLQHANAGLVRGTRHSEPDAWRRLGDYMLQSFRTAGEPLHPIPAVWARNAPSSRHS